MVVLVNPQDEVLGLMEKQQAHINGLLHRAFSVFYLMKMAKCFCKNCSAEKYHSPHQWTNAVCSHPRIEETYLEGANRRLNEELGIEAELSENFILSIKLMLEAGFGSTSSTMFLQELTIQTSI
ncbi:NUDIX hydrolase [Chryseobacterium indoltheticum]|uniref:NUDIX hydrolase n=1 Tax=Chryseobacterium indoltheticum TaxID=254 RepID=UPI003F49A1CE